MWDLPINDIEPIDLRILAERIETARRKINKIKFHQLKIQDEVKIIKIKGDKPVKVTVLAFRKGFVVISDERGYIDLFNDEEFNDFNDVW